MDLETKNRLAFYAGKQRKSVSQLITEWVWNQPVETYTKEKPMTPVELQTLLKREFDVVALDINDNIMFAAPIPGVDGEKFGAERPIIWDDEEITARCNAWVQYVNTLPMYVRRVVNAGSL